MGSLHILRFKSSQESTEVAELTRTHPPPATCAGEHVQLFTQSPEGFWEWPCSSESPVSRRMCLGDGLEHHRENLLIRILKSITVIIIQSLESRQITSHCCLFFGSKALCRRDTEKQRHRKSNVGPLILCPPHHHPSGCLFSCKALSAVGPDLEAAKSAD